MLYWWASGEYWEIVRVGSGVERTDRQGRHLFAGARSTAWLCALGLHHQLDRGKVDFHSCTVSVYGYHVAQEGTH